MSVDPNFGREDIPSGKEYDAHGVRPQSKDRVQRASESAFLELDIVVCSLVPDAPVEMMNA